MRMRKCLWVVVFGLILIGCMPVDRAESTDDKALETATFAGGCFWCMEAPFETIDGVESVISGYSGGVGKAPSYKEVSGGGTGFAEAIQVHYDPSRVSYEQLLQIFWRQINPTDAGGQFYDRGDQYRTEIFFHDAGQQAAAERSKAELEASGRFDEPIVTPVTPFTRFYPAEE